MMFSYVFDSLEEGYESSRRCVAALDLFRQEAEHHGWNILPPMIYNLGWQGFSKGRHTTNACGIFAIYIASLLVTHHPRWREVSYHEPSANEVDSILDSMAMFVARSKCHEQYK